MTDGDRPDGQTDAFERNRPRLRAIAYRMLGSLAEAEDAVQDAWLRMNRSDTSEVHDLDAWLTTVLGRVCLNALRSRNTRQEQPMGVHVPDPIVTRSDGPTPEDEAVLADSVGLALYVVLETLDASERLAFVLHDMFDMPFDQIAPIVGRQPAATRQLASRARRRVRDSEVPAPDLDLNRQREVVDAFFAAARRGEMEALVAALHSDVVLRSDGGTAPGRESVLVRGAAAVAGRAVMFHRPTTTLRPVLVNGAAGMIVVDDGRVASVMAFTVSDGRIVEIDALADPERLARLDLPFP